MKTYSSLKEQVKQHVTMAEQFLYETQTMDKNTFCALNKPYNSELMLAAYHKS